MSERQASEPAENDRADTEVRSRNHKDDDSLTNPDRASWPPAFSDSYVETVKERFAQSGQLAIVGPLGSNRGMLASLVTEAPEQGAVWWRSDASRVRARHTYAAVNHLLPTLDAQPEQSVSEVVDAATDYLRSNSAGTGLPAVILREADLSDNESIDVLLELARRKQIRLVTTAGDEFVNRLPSKSDVVHLEPLDRSVITYLLEHRFGAQAHPLTVAMLAARSQGAYGVLKDIAEIDFAAGRLAIVAGVLLPTVLAGPSGAVIDESFQPDDYLRHIGRGPNDTRHDAVGVAALAEQLDLEEARVTFGADQVEAVVKLGVAHIEDDALIFTSLAEASLMQRSMGVGRRRELYDKYGPHLAISFTRPPAAVAVANWLLSLEESLDPQLALRATTAANHAGRYAQAMRFIRSVEFARRPAHLLMEQAHALNETGSTEGLIELLELVDLRTLPDVDLVPFLMWSKRHLPPEEFSERFETLRVDAHGDLPRLAAIEVFEQTTPVHCTAAEYLGRELQALINSPHLAPVNRGIAMTLYAVWARSTTRAQTAVETARQAKQLFENDADATAFHLQWATEIAALACISSDDLGEAERMLTDYSAIGAPYGTFGRLGMALWGAFSFYSGNVRAALANFATALNALPTSDPHNVRGWCEALLAQAVAQTGELEQVTRLVEASSSRPVGPTLLWELERRISEGCAYDSAGDPDTALDRLAEVIDIARSNELRLAEVDAAALSVQIGGPGFNWLLLRATKNLDHASGTAAIWKRFAAAIGANNMPDLADLAVSLDAHGSHVFAAEVAQFTLDIARRASDMTPEQRSRLSEIADPMAHRHVAR